MRKAYFVRHAKSSWSNPGLSDKERPLNKRGKRDGPFMAEKLAIWAPSIDLVLCSSARRTRDTLEYFKQQINIGEIQFIDDLYHAWTETIVDVLSDVGEEAQSVMLFGHNPGFTYVHNKFAEAPIDNLPTCGIFELQCSSSWIDLDTTNTSVGMLIYPKMYTS